MFFRLLFILACIRLYKDIKSFVESGVVAEISKGTEVSKTTYVSIVITILFYVMVMAICIIPSLLPKLLW